MGLGGLCEWEDAVHVHARAALANEVVGSFEVRGHPHRRAVDDELLPPQPVEASRRAVTGCRATDDDSSVLRGCSERALPRRLADRLDDDVRPDRRWPRERR